MLHIMKKCFPKAVVCHSFCSADYLDRFQTRINCTGCEVAKLQQKVDVCLDTQIWGSFWGNEIFSKSALRNFEKTL